MSCGEQILSNDYAEILLDYQVVTPNPDFPDVCFEVVDDKFVIVYVERRLIPPINVTTYTYNSIPKLYGLMQESAIPGKRSFDPLSLIRSGILQVQRAAPCPRCRACSCSNALESVLWWAFCQTSRLPPPYDRR